MSPLHSLRKRLIVRVNAVKGENKYVKRATIFFFVYRYTYQAITIALTGLYAKFIFQYTKSTP